MPDFESIELTSFESYELAEITDELDRVNRAHDSARRRMDNLARAVLKDFKTADLSAWSFHIDAPGKRVVIRREVEKHEALEEDEQCPHCTTSYAATNDAGECPHCGRQIRVDAIPVEAPDAD